MPAPKSSRLTQYRLQQLLHYNARTGEFTWRVDKAGRFARVGKPAGNWRKSGHMVIGIDGRLYSAARLAWLYVKGEFPPCNITFVDRNTRNLAFDNLITTIETNKKTYKATYNRNYYRARRNLLLYGDPLANPNKMEAMPDQGAPAEARSSIWGTWDGTLDTYGLPATEQAARAAARRARQRKPLKGTNPE